MLGVLPELKEGDDPAAVDWAGQHFAKTTMAQVIGMRASLLLEALDARDDDGAVSYLDLVYHMDRGHQHLRGLPDRLQPGQA
jgi:hypothetical protein